jgi:hypothetical protein
VSCCTVSCSCCLAVRASCGSSNSSSRWQAVWLGVSLLVYNGCGHCTTEDNRAEAPLARCRVSTSCVYCKLQSKGILWQQQVADSVPECQQTSWYWLWRLTTVDNVAEAPAASAMRAAAYVSIAAAAHASLISTKACNQSIATQQQTPVNNILSYQCLT